MSPARQLRRDSVYMIAGQASLAALLALQFLLVARVLGPLEFGIVASATAITAALMPYSGMGLGKVAMIRMARAHTSGAICVGNALVVTMVTGAACIGIAVLAGHVLLPRPGAWLLVLLFAVSEILVARHVDTAAHVFLGLDRHLMTVLVYHMPLVARALCAIALYVLPIPPTSLHWGALQLLGMLVALGVVAVVTLRAVGMPRTDLRMATSDARVGVFYSVAASAHGVYTDADKALLARYAAPEIGGAYTVAFRLMFIAYTPVMAVLMALQTRVFRAGGEGGLVGTAHMMTRLAVSGGMYCLLVSGAIYILAPLVPLLLGQAYALSSEVLRSLCLLPLPMMVQAVYSQALAGADEQKAVALMYTGAALLSVLLNLVLIPGNGWQGSVMSAYLSQGLLALAIVAYIGRRRLRHTAAIVPAGSAQ